MQNLENLLEKRHPAGTSMEQPQALELIQVITAKNPITSSCVLDAPHPIADVLDGAQQIPNDVIAGCH